MALDMTTSSRPAPAPPAGASEKTLRVLSAALDHARFTDIVFETRLPKATVHRIIGTLIEQGYLVPRSFGGYQAGPGLVSLAGRAMAGIDVAALAQDVVDDLVARTESTVHMGVVGAGEMVYVLRRDPEKPYRMKSQVGRSLPMHCSGMGKAVMATWTPERVDRLVAQRGLPARTEATITTAEALHAELAMIRERGYALDLGENEDGIVCVSAAIRSHTGEYTHALSVSSIALEHPGTSIERYAPLALDAGAAISRRLAAPA